MKKITIIFFVLFIASTKVVVQVRAVANNYNLSVASSSNVRFYDGTSPTGVIGANEYASVITDINNNGKPDIIIGNYAHSNNGRSASGSVYVIYDDKFASLHGTNNNIDFTSPSVYSVRFDGATANEELSDGGVFAGDVTGDGKTDILIGSWGDHNSRNDSGSLYILSNTLINGYVGTGNNVDLNTSASFNIRIDGSVANEIFSYTGTVVNDFNADGANDLVVSAGYNYSRAYLFSGTFLNTLTGTGNVVDLNNSSKFTVRFDGVGGTRFSMRNTNSGYLDNNVIPDIIFGAYNASHNGRSASGSIYVLMNALISTKMNAGPGLVVDLSNSSNFSIRFDGAVANSQLSGIAGNGSGDLTGNSLSDLVISSSTADNNSRTDSGSIYIVSDSLLAQWTGTGNIIDMANTNNWNLRIDGEVAGGNLGWGGNTNIRDVSNDGKNDLLVGASRATLYGLTNNGAYYLIRNESLGNLATVGNTLDLANVANYSMRWTGGGAGYWTGVNEPSFLSDLNSDGTIDFALYTRNIGTAFVIYNFPHTITTDALANADINSADVIATGTVSAPNSVTNISGVQWSLSNNPQGSWTPCTASDGSFSSTTETYSCTMTGFVDGSHTVYFRAFDQNSTYTPVAHYASVSFTTDTESPSSGLKINNNDTLTDSVSVTLSPISVGATEMMLSNSSDFSGSSWESYATSKSWTLSSADGIKTVYAKFKDAAGNVSSIASDSITLDTQAPSSAVVINGGSSLTSIPAVSLALSSTDITTVVEYMMLSNSSDFSGSSWEPYVTTKSWTLPAGSGEKRVYVKFKDSAGNVSAIYSDTITLDTTAPELEWHTSTGETRTFSFDTVDNSTTSSISSDNLYTEDTLPTFTFTKAGDSTSGVDRYQILLQKEGSEGFSLYIDNIPPDKPGSGNDPSDKTRENDERYIYYGENDSLKVRSKKESDRLTPGAYKFKIRVFDKTGNYTDSPEKILRVKSHSAVFSTHEGDTSFPLTILTVGERSNLNITSLDPTSIPQSLSISSLTPTFYGIANNGATVYLELLTERFDPSINSTRKEIFLKKETTVNGESRYGMNLTPEDGLTPGTYLVHLMAQNDQKDYVELPEFTLKVATNTYTPPPVLGVSDERQETKEDTSQTPPVRPTQLPSRIPKSSSAPTSTPSPKTCILFDLVCW